MTMQTPPRWESGRGRTAQLRLRAVSVPMIEMRAAARWCEGGAVDRGVDLQSADGGRRCVQRADRAVPPRAPRALLPDARIVPGRGRDAPGDAARCLAGTRRVRGPRLAADLALPDRHEPLLERTTLGEPAAGQGVERARR